MKTIILWILEAYVIVLFGRIILSWFPIQQGSPLEPVARVLSALTEPVLGPLRRALPPVRAGGMGFDFSPLIVLLVLQIVLIPLFR